MATSLSLIRFRQNEEISIWYVILCSITYLERIGYSGRCRQTFGRERVLRRNRSVFGSHPDPRGKLAPSRITAPHTFSITRQANFVRKTAAKLKYNGAEAHWHLFSFVLCFCLRPCWCATLYLPFPLLFRPKPFVSQTVGCMVAEIWASHRNRRAFGWMVLDP